MEITHIKVNLSFHEHRSLFFHQCINDRAISLRTNTRSSQAASLNRRGSTMTVNILITILLNKIVKASPPPNGIFLKKDKNDSLWKGIVWNVKFRINGITVPWRSIDP